MTVLVLSNPGAVGDRNDPEIDPHPAGRVLL